MVKHCYGVGKEFGMLQIAQDIPMPGVAGMLLSWDGVGITV